MATEDPVRCTVIFRGHVQGVGFRFTTVTSVSKYAITGYVMNRRDGSVEMVAEGPRRTVSSAIHSVLGAMGGHVTGHDEDWGPATGEFDGFGVRYARP